jgi:alkanesulfonate monooxygenase SsuD/methylene tetrahydromethanopterin reductase-like flavin-dependent oxidoreductase (luciferase family)
MGHSLRFQVLSLPNVPWVELKARVLRLEEMGIEVAALADHFVDWTNPPSPWFESWSTLAALADATSTIRLTTCVSQIPLRNPAMLARQALTVDHISNGRLEVGLGTGITVDPSYDMIGIPNWPPKERMQRFAEYVEIVDRLLSDEVTSFSGTYYEIAGAHMNPRPVQSPRPPLLVGALGPSMIRIAARRADIWNSMSFHADFEAQLAETSGRIELMGRECASVGRDPSAVRHSYTMFDAAARPKGGEIDYYTSKDLFVEMVGRIIQLGITEIGLYYPLHPSQVAVFESIVCDVLPQLRAAVGSGDQVVK